MSPLRTSLLATVAVTAALTLMGCATGTATDSAPTSAAPTEKSTPTPKPTPTPPPDSDGDGVPDAQDDFPTDPNQSEQLYYPSGDPVLPGYPLVVDTAQLDYRLANWIKTPQAVALAPGVYAGYNPAVTDLTTYLTGPSNGDCAVRDVYFPGTGGSCWDGVLASPAEPAQ